jgi:pyruvate carboxylase
LHTLLCRQQQHTTHTHTTKRRYDLDYYINLTEQLVECDIHFLAIKDMAGLLKPKAATMLVSALRERLIPQP